ncbi:hypothetical protein ARTHRO9AX_100142 [Arthrobacter sp. 9AX]|nr:hypothetical protein ARTHRO9AX_100142 [Arthrobacter sp. 9AX]
MRPWHERSAVPAVVATGGVALPGDSRHMAGMMVVLRRSCGRCLLHPCRVNAVLRGPRAPASPPIA